MKLITSIKTTLAVLAGITILTPSVTLAQSRFTNQVYRQLDQAASALGLNNYSRSHDPYVNNLNHNNYGYITLNLRGGWNYAIVGVCDEDCSDLDLTLYDENGNVIDYDTEPDDTPVVTVTPQWSGGFRVKVDMASCSYSPCYYGVGVFVR